MQELSSLIDRFFGKYAILVRYLISGGTSFGTNIVTLYLFTDICHIYYLVSAVMSFLIAFVVSFLMMKHWTFQNNSTDGVHKQAAAYFGVALVNLVLNTLLLYIFVDYVGLWYVYGQVVTSLLIAVSSFFIYKYLIFK